MTDQQHTMFILDNGAATIKSGFSTDSAPTVIPNCKMKVKSERQRQYVGDQIDDCKDCSGLFYILAHQRGFILNWDTEREVWDYLFTRKFKTLVPKETDIIITEPYFNFKSIQNNIDEVLFEEHGFKSILRTNAGFLSSFQHRTTNKSKNTAQIVENGDQVEPQEFPLACLVVDSGFSFTHIAPYIYSEKHGYVKLKRSIRRVDVGGKALTNHLKEIISYRQMNVMDETYVINQCKEDVCFVATDFYAKLNECQQRKHNKVVRDYILPDFTNVKRGYARKPDWRQTSTRVDPTSTEPQFVRLANERFQVPELLFHPSDIGMNQVGIVEAIVDCIDSVPTQAKALLYKNIVLTGGNAKIPGFKERLTAGVRSYCTSHYEVNVTLPEDPINHAWFGGKAFATDFGHLYKDLAITKKEYEESGDNKKQICIDKFDT